MLVGKDDRTCCVSVVPEIKLDTTKSGLDGFGVEKGKVVSWNLISRLTKNVQFLCHIVYILFDRLDIKKGLNVWHGV